MTVLLGKEPPGVHVRQPFYVHFYGGSTLQRDERSKSAQENEEAHKLLDERRETESVKVE